MKRETLKALKQSIQKWKKVVDGSGCDNGSENCALCERFGAGTCELLGEQCPVRKAIGKKDCRGTPFIAWQCHHKTKHNITDFPYRVQTKCKTCVTLAEKELEFLKSLLPVKS